MLPTVEDIAGCRILIVDDEPDNLSVIERVLSFHGAKVLTATDGASGLRAAREANPMLVLLDLSMPIMDGWDMHRQMRNDPGMKRIPVIAVTAHAMTEDRQRVYAEGFDGYIMKPFNVPFLLREIARHLRASAQAVQAGKSH